FLEVGPHPVLGAAIMQCLRAHGRDGFVLSSLRREEDERTTLLAALGRLYTGGHPVNWASVHPPGARFVRLPRYPWQRQRHWLDAASAPQHSEPNGAHPLLGREARIAPVAGVRIWEAELSTRRLPYLAGHRVDGATLLPVAAY